MTRIETESKLKKDGFSISPDGICRNKGYWFHLKDGGFQPLKPFRGPENVLLPFKTIGDWYESD
jgi:hypothetical protein